MRQEKIYVNRSYDFGLVLDGDRTFSGFIGGFGFSGIVQAGKDRETSYSLGKGNNDS